MPKKRTSFAVTPEGAVEASAYRSVREDAELATSAAGRSARRAPGKGSGDARSGKEPSSCKESFSSSTNAKKHFRNRMR